MRVPRTLVRSLVVLGAAGLALPIGAVPAYAVAPTVTAWWSATNTVPAPPDVGKHDLLVQGAAGDPGGEAPGGEAPGGAAPGGGAPGAEGVPPAPSPSPSGPSGPNGEGAHGGSTAIAGLRFEIPDGYQADELTLGLKGAKPPRTTVRACAATEPFEPASNGPFRDVPAYDCSGSLAGHLTEDGKVVFGGVDRLARGGTLSIVLLPGHVDRLVIAKPGAGALTVHKSAPPRQPFAPDSGLPAGGPSGAGAGGSGAFGGSDAPSLRSGTAGAAKAGKGAAAGEEKTRLPVVGPPANKPAKAALPVPFLHGLPATIALACALALAVLGFLLPLLRRAMPIAVVIGDASQAPVVVGGPGQRRQRGVGRFVAEREGSPPRL